MEGSNHHSSAVPGNEGSAVPSDAPVVGRNGKTFVDEVGVAPIKWKYIVPKEAWQQKQRERMQAAASVVSGSAGSGAPSTAAGTAETGPHAAGEGQEAEQGQDLDAAGEDGQVAGADQPAKKRPRGQNKGRNAAELGFTAGRAEAALCRWVLQGQADKCKWGPNKCRDGHDLEAFLKSRPADLGPSCPVFAIRGYCPSGLACRWARSHSDADTGAQVSLPPEQRPAVRDSVNTLPYDMTTALRKGTYKFSHPLSRGLSAVHGQGQAQGQQPAAGAGAGVEALTKSATSQAWRPGMPAKRPPAKDAEGIGAGGSKRARVVVHEEASGGAGGGGAGAGAAATAPQPPDTLAPVLHTAPHVHDADRDGDAVQARELPGALVAEVHRVPAGEKAGLDLRGKIYVAPLTTVGNLPFRRVMVDLGAQVTCGEMALAEHLVQGQASEWALMRRHPSEKCFGVQLAGHRPDVMAQAGELIARTCAIDFVDINSGCPLDDLCQRGCGAALMGKPGRARDCVLALDATLPVRVTYKMRTGLDKDTSARFAHRFIGKMRLWSAASEYKLSSRWEARRALLSSWSPSGPDGWEGEEEDEGKGRLPHPLAAVTVHGRTRQQRYSSYADWSYIASCVRAGSAPLVVVPRSTLTEGGYDVTDPLSRVQWGLAPRAGPSVARLGAPTSSSSSSSSTSGGEGGADAEVNVSEQVSSWDPCLDLSLGHLAAPVTLRPRPLPVLGNGDVMCWEEWAARQEESGCTTVLLGRGPLIKPWLCTEIAERRTWDIRSGERLDILRSFVSHGLEHWGSDQAGVNRTRRFLLEWLSFLCRYVPVGLLERLPQRMNDRPLPYYGRDDLESLMASTSAEDWVRLSEMLLGPVPSDFVFLPKHKSNSYAGIAAEDMGLNAGAYGAAGGGGGSSGGGDAGVRMGVSAAVVRAWDTPGTK